MSEHTPGPWKIEDSPTSRGNIVVIDYEGLIPCPGSGGAMSYTQEICQMSWAGGEHSANAALIASAPDLKAENERLREALAYLHDRSNRMIMELESLPSPRAGTRLTYNKAMADALAVLGGGS